MPPAARAAVVAVLVIRVGQAIQGCTTGPTPRSACRRACLKIASAASRPLSPVFDARAAITPATHGVENDVPLHSAIPEKTRTSPRGVCGSCVTNVPSR